jgi:SNF family Na+-dependent transporter
MKEKANIEFTKEEAKSLLDIVDKVVKVVGITDGAMTANNAVYFCNKINKAFKEENNVAKQ